MKNKIYIAFLIVINLNSAYLFANEDGYKVKLWKNFFHNMPATDVVDGLKNFKQNHRGKEKTGVKFTVDKKLDKNPVSMFGGLHCYNSIYQNEKIRVMGSSTYTQFCFNKPTQRKNISSTNKLKLIHMKFHYHNNRISDALYAKYGFYNLDLTGTEVNGQELTPNQLKNCRGGNTYLEKNLISIFDGGDTLIFYSIIPDIAASNLYGKKIQ